jgi:GTP cyclohydrolase II
MADFYHRIPSNPIILFSHALMHAKPKLFITFLNPLIAKGDIMIPAEKVLEPPPTIRQQVLIETPHGTARFVTFKNLADPGEHIALVFGAPKGGEAPLVRIHSECLTGDVFGSGRCDCGEQLQEAQRKMAQQGGVILYLRQEGRGIGLYNKIDAYKFQDLGYDTFQANKMIGLPEDSRSYLVAAQMLEALQVRAVKLLTNNPDKVTQLARYVEVVEAVPTSLHLKAENRNYLLAKVEKGGHILDIDTILAGAIS